MNYQKILFQISDHIDQSNNYKNKLDILYDKSKYLNHKAFSSENTPTEEQLILEEQLESIIKLCAEKIAIIYDLIGTSDSRIKFIKDFKSIKDLSNLEHHHTFDFSYIESIGYINKHSQILNDLIVTPRISDLNMVEKILKNTNKIIYDYEITPTSEKVVKHKVKDVLSYYFSDVVQEMPIINICKTFKPDIGLKNLQLAIEYKYATSKQEVKTIIGGIYEDIGGYSSSHDWKNFIAVLYLTEPFYTEEQIIAQFNKKEFPKNWKIIVVYGIGTRKSQLKGDKK